LRSFEVLFIESKEKKFAKYSVREDSAFAEHRNFEGAARVLP
jgi:hypothetical protein